MLAHCRAAARRPFSCHAPSLGTFAGIRSFPAARAVLLAGIRSFSVAPAVLLAGIRSFPVAPAVLLASCLVPAAAVAQPHCLSRTEMVARLAESYGELPRAAGVTANGSLLELLASPDGATWSILITGPRGRSCLVSAGEAWRSRGVDQKEPKPMPEERGA